MAKPTTVLELRGVTRSFVQGEARLDVLKGVDMSINAGEVVGLLGPSGSGKSTLLHIAGLLEPPTFGDVFIEGKSCTALSDGQKTKLRRDRLGFIYQFHHLLPEFSALENVSIPQMIAGKSAGKAAERSRELLSGLGLGERLDHQPGQLSGGEQQRVAIARALANGPKLLLADEPTGNLDPKTSDGVFDNLLTLVREHGLAAFIATHNYDLAARMDRCVKLEDGRFGL